MENLNTEALVPVTTQLLKWEHPLTLECGAVLNSIDIAYETYGELNAHKSNTILICHAFSGDAHAAGIDSAGRKGWWDSMIGPGKAFDTNKYFMICSNILGGCRGTTGPSSINPKTGRHYATDFPVITVKDIVAVQKILIDHLGIDKLLSISGGSMGGMQVLQWVADYPERVLSVIPIATSLKHSPQQIAFNEVARQAIISDPTWKSGYYYDNGQPERGLALARMIGHITYMSDKSMEEKFSRQLKKERLGFSFDADFQVEGYLHYKGDRFVQRFDANSYLYITKAMDYFDLADQDLFPPNRRFAVKFLVISFQSDWLYPSYQSRDLVRLLKTRFVDVTYCEVPSTYGHDAFLLEIGQQEMLVKGFLDRVFKGAK
ncbi:MAG TPA: homoserine O-acetyltransferase [Dissulfurispiraceae bacterium]|nr:homoserine O-acetyltransferase [Dissulfurispiraceae bacterium]